MLLSEIQIRGELWEHVLAAVDDEDWETARRHEHLLSQIELGGLHSREVTDAVLLTLVRGL